MKNKDKSLRATHTWGVIGLIVAAVGIVATGFGIVVACLLWVASISLGNKNDIAELNQNIADARHEIVDMKEDLVVFRGEFIAFREETRKQLAILTALVEANARQAEPQVSKTP